MESDIRPLLDATFTRADWHRFIRRLARTRNVESARILLRAAFGPPPEFGAPDTTASQRSAIWLPLINAPGHELAIQAPQPPGPPALLTRLLDEALTTDEWQALLRWLSHTKTPGAMQLLWDYRFGGRAAPQPPPDAPPQLVHFYQPIAAPPARDSNQT